MKKEYCTIKSSKENLKYFEEHHQEHIPFIGKNAFLVGIESDRDEKKQLISLSNNSLKKIYAFRWRTEPAPENAIVATRLRGEI